MQNYAKVVLCSLLVFLASFTIAQDSLAQNEITFAGVTHTVTPSGVYTNLGLGINFDPGNIVSACVVYPDNSTEHCYSADQFYEELGETFYFVNRAGPPQIGTYIFTVSLTDSTELTATDTQGPLISLPIIPASDVTVTRNHTGTPTFSWPNSSIDNYYRIQIFDDFGTTLFRSERSTTTSVSIPAGTLLGGIAYHARVEVHDSDSYATLNNRSNGEMIFLDTIVIPLAGVTNVNTPEGLKTHLDIVTNVDPGDVAQAYVSGPGAFYYQFQAADYLPQFNEYFKALDGSPLLGNYTFTVVLNDGTTQSVTDTQGPLETLPIILESEYDVIGNDGVTPTLKWPEVEGRVLFYRLIVRDSGGNDIIRSSRLGGTAYVTAPGELAPDANYQMRVEIHDSNNFESLDNRSNGEMLAFTTGNLPGPPSDPLTVIPVPWVATAPLIPHDTYNGREITFKVIARGGNGEYLYEWDFDGDGTYDFSDTTNDRYDLSAKHTYPDQVFDKIFIARIRVTSGGDSVTAEYPVRVHATATQSVKVNVAIDEALWWMHQNMLRWDSGIVQYGKLSDQALGATGAAVQAWENQGHKPGGNYDTNPYVEDVRRGLNFILSKSHPYPIYSEDGRDPDTLVNGYGIHSISQSQLYETGIVLMALASAGDASLISEVGGFGLYERAYGDIAQDMADFLAFAQNEPDVGVWRGGWRYAPNYSQSDMSVTQWPVIGLEAAGSNFGTIVPVYVKEELELYLAEDQDSNGGFGYTAPGGNVARTGAGIACLAWIGKPSTDTDVTRAINFIDNNWSWDHLENRNLYAMYAVMKGMREFEPDLTKIGDHDWYPEYADFLIGQQSADGYWTSDVWFGRDLSTAMGVLILTPEVFVSPPVAVAKASPREASPGTVITFDHSGSYHRDPSRELVAFRWDFNEDGVWDFPRDGFPSDDIDAKPTWTYDDSIACGQEVEHKAILEVEDDLGNTDVDDETVIIRINLKNHPPVADGDPTDSYPNYYVLAGGAILLDATQSYDPDATHGDFITKWEWDVNNDGIFEASGETLRFQIPEDWDPGSIHTVTLRVTDDGSWASDCGGLPNLTDETTILIAVGEGPDCGRAIPSISKIWPPNHKMVSIDVLGVANAQGEPAKITIIGISQDEPVNGLGDGDATPDGMGVGTSTAHVRAESSGTGNGRVYEIRFVAVDDSGAECVGSVNISVPHNKKNEAIDDGQVYDSTKLQ